MSFVSGGTAPHAAASAAAGDPRSQQYGRPVAVGTKGPAATCTNPRKSSVDTFTGRSGSRSRALSPVVGELIRGR